MAYVNDNTPIVGSTKPIIQTSMTQKEFLQTTKPTYASITNQATGLVSASKGLTTKKEDTSGAVITKSNDTSSSSSSIYDNKYIMYGGIGLLAIGLLYIMYKD